MMGRFRTMPAAAVVLALLLAACGGGQDEPTFTQEQFDALILSADQAPEGTSLSAPDSGPITLDEVWQSDCCQEQQDATREAGWQAARLNVFGGEEGGPLLFALSAAMLFEDGEGAGESIAIVDRWITGDEDAPSMLLAGLPTAETPEPVSTEGLGEDATGYAVSGTTEQGDEAQTIVLFWRVGNASLQARVVGFADGFGLDDVRAIADAMNDGLPT